MKKFSLIATLLFAVLLLQNCKKDTVTATTISTAQIIATINDTTWTADTVHAVLTYTAATKNKVFTTAKDKNDWKIFLLDWFQPNIPLLALRKIKCPSLIIGGDHDVINIQHTVLIYQNIPHAYLWIVPNSPHSTLKDHADEFNKQVDDFFTQPFHNWN